MNKQEKMLSEMAAILEQNGVAATPQAMAAALSQPPAGGLAVPQWLASPNMMGAANLPAPVSFSVPVEITVNDPMKGPVKVTVDLGFTADAWPRATEIVSAMMGAGLKVKAWAPKPEYNGGGGGGGGRPPYNGGGGNSWGGGGGSHRGGY